MANPNWTKGVSGNPRGRPKDALGQLLRGKEDLPEEIYKAIHPLLQSKNEKIRIQAAEFLRDSAWGKPVSVFTDSEGGVFPFGIIRPDDERRVA